MSRPVRTIVAGVLFGAGTLAILYTGLSIDADARRVRSRPASAPPVPAAQAAPRDGELQALEQLIVALEAKTDAAGRRRALAYITDRLTPPREQSR